MKRPHIQNITPFFIEDIINFKNKKNLSSEETITNLKINKKITAVIVARLKSKRLPNKALKLINKKTTLDHLIQRLKLSKQIDNIILATTKNIEDKKICDIAKLNKIPFYRGDEKNVLNRMFQASKKLKSDIVIRVTGDDILIDPNYLDKLINFHLKNNLEYSNNKDLPGGTEVEIFNQELLKFLLKVIKEKDGTEYLTFYIQKYKDQFNINSLKVPDKHKSNLSLTIDTKEDFYLLKNFAGNEAKEEKNYEYEMDDIIYFLKKNKKKPLKNRLKKKININTDFVWEKVIN